MLTSNRGPCPKRFRWLSFRGFLPIVLGEQTRKLAQASLKPHIQAAAALLGFGRGGWGGERQVPPKGPGGLCSFFSPEKSQSSDERVHSPLVDFLYCFNFAAHACLCVCACSLTVACLIELLQVCSPRACVCVCVCVCVCSLAFALLIVRLQFCSLCVSVHSPVLDSVFF